MRLRRLSLALSMGIYVGAVLERVAHAEQRLCARLMELERAQPAAAVTDSRV
jgi:hypothetical protein